MNKDSGVSDMQNVQAGGGTAGQTATRVSGTPLTVGDRPGVHWIALSDTNPPPRPGFYWLLGINNRYRILAHWDGDGGWRGMNAGGESIRLLDTYTHFTPVREPAI